MSNISGPINGGGTATGSVGTSASLSTLLGAYLTSNSASTRFSSIAHSHYVSGLSDVSIKAVKVDGDVLAWSSAAGQYTLQAQSGGTGITKLVSAADVTISSPTDNQYLTFVSADGKWHNTTIPDWITSTNASAISSAIASAVFVTNIGPYLTSASAETRFPRAFASLTDVTVSAATDNQYLTFVSADGKWHNTTIPDWITSAAASVLVSTLTVNHITSASASTLASTVAFNQNFEIKTNTTISALGNGQIMVYRTADSKWHNEAQAGGGITNITSASDATVAVARTGHTLVYDTTDSKFRNLPRDNILLLQNFSGRLIGSDYLGNNPTAQADLNFSNIAIGGGPNPSGIVVSTLPKPYLGYAVCQTSTSASGGVGLARNTVPMITDIAISSIVYRTYARILVDSLAVTAGASIDCFFGFSDQALGGASTLGTGATWGFLIQSGSGQIQVVSRDAVLASVSAINSGTSASTSVWYNLRVDICVGSSIMNNTVTWFINGTQVASSTGVSLSTNVASCVPVCKIQKLGTADNNNHMLFVDYLYMDIYYIGAERGAV